MTVFQFNQANAILDSLPGCLRQHDLKQLDGGDYIDDRVITGVIVDAVHQDVAVIVGPIWRSTTSKLSRARINPSPSATAADGRKLSAQAQNLNEVKGLECGVDFVAPHIELPTRVAQALRGIEMAAAVARRNTRPASTNSRAPYVLRSSVCGNCFALPDA